MSLASYYQEKKYNKINKFRKEAILAFIDKKGAKILDVGCGNGGLGEILKREKAAVVYGVDISQDAVSEARKRIDKAFYFNAEGEWPEDIKKAEYDFIILSEVLEHLLEPEKVLEKVKEAAGKKAEIIITVPNVLFWKNRLKIFSGHFEYADKGLMDSGHIHFFSYQSLKKDLWRAGLEITAENHHFPTRFTKFLGKFFPGLFAYQFVLKAKRKNKVVYTAIFGSKDQLLEPEFLPDGFDFVCFTDSDFKSDIWLVVKVEPPFENSAKAAKIFKILPHKFLRDYNISVWADGNISVRGDINRLCDKYLAMGDMAFFDHNQLAADPRNCVYKEAEAILAMAEKNKIKDDPAVVKKQMEKYRQEKYPAGAGLIAGGIILRRHNKKEVAAAMEKWWEEIEVSSIRDQLSFNYIARKNKIDFSYMKGDLRNNKFFSFHHHDR